MDSQKGSMTEMVAQKYDNSKMGTGFTPGNAYIGPKRMVSVIFGSSMSDAIASDILSGSNDGYKSGQGNMIMNNSIDRNIREKINPNRDKITEKFLFEMYGKFDHWKKEIELSHLRTDLDTNNPRENKRENYNYQNKYQKYEKKDKITKERERREKCIEPEYKAGQKDERLSKLYGLESTTELTQQEYKPLKETTSTQQTQNRRQDRKTLETMLYSTIADSHAYQSLTKPDNVQNYITTNGDYTISLSEGYIKELDLRYLNLTVKNKEEEQNYQLLIRYQRGRDRKIEAEKEIAEEIEKLSKRLNKKDKIDEREIMETLTATLKRKKLKLELTEEEIKLIRKTKEDKGRLRRIWLLDKKKKKFTTLDIKKEIKININAQKYYQKPTITFNYPAKAAYLANFERKRNDFTNLVPAKNIHKFPISLMGGVLGFTYLGDSFVGIRDDLNGYEANEVEIHEAIHTPDEYETRVITKWMLDDKTHYH